MRDRRNHPLVRLLLLGLLLMLAGGAGPVLAQTPAPAAPSAQDYRLGPGDKLNVNVYGESQLSGEYIVNANGTLALPLIEPVPVTGLTLAETQSLIRDRLAAGFLGNPIVSVGILDYRPFFIIGEVVKPGSYPYVAGMTVLHAVAIAGGFTPRAAKEKIVIQRGDQEGIRVQQSSPLQPGDIVTVKERFF